MAHIEDTSAHDICVKQTEELTHQCFMMAERIVRASAKRLGVADVAEMFHSVPMVASEIRATILNAAGMLGSFSSEKSDKLISDIDIALASLTKRNKEARET
jgi:hypothetical protein